MNSKNTIEKQVNSEAITSEDFFIRVRQTLPSEVMQDIVSNKPDIIIQWGTTIFFFILCLLILVCWMVKYPEVIHAPAKLTSINAPKPVVSLINGKLQNLKISENEIVKKGQILGYLESTASHNDVIMLSSKIDSIQSLIINNQIEDIHRYFNKSTMRLGELQDSYEAFSQYFLILRDYLSDGFYVNKKTILAKDMSNLFRLNETLKEQKKLQEEDLSLTQKTFNANETLANNKVISEFDYRSEKSKYLIKKLNLPQIDGAIINNESDQNEKLKEILELENTIKQKKINFQNSLSTFKSHLDDWMKRYLLIAPIDGKVAFASFVQENQQVEQNQTVCFINPENSQFFAEIVIPQSNFGKVALNQKVLLKFHSYPYQEYGSVNGRIEFISHIPVDNGYLAKISLPNNLYTTYGKTVQYRDGLQANAEIITQDMRLLERFYYHIFKSISI